MSDQVSELVRSTPVLLVAGIVGGGKNTVINELLKDHDYHEIISHTTRAPRNNHGTIEQDGVDYYFIDEHQAETMLRNRSFIEAKYVHGNLYGTSAAELESAKSTGKIAVTDIDIQGVVEYLDIKPDTFAVFLLPPSVDTWVQRLERRYGNLDDHREEITKRFNTAREEIKHIQADKRFIIVINDDLKTTVERIEQIVAGTVTKSSEYADVVTEHLLQYLDSEI